MDAKTMLTDALARCPLVAILRGVRPDEVESIAAAVIDAGFSMVEVPLNSPDPFDSIARLVRRFGDRTLIGAGTVLTPADVARVAETGARMVISPNTDTAVIAATVRAGLVSLPGYLTPSEAFAALGAGATGLKLFPAEAASPRVLNAHRAVVPRTVPILVVGGITPENMSEWRNACEGFGLGSALYRAGLSAADVRNRADRFFAAVAK